MCGRYGRTTPAAVFAEMIEARLSDRLDTQPNFNVAPGLFHPIALRSPSDHSLVVGPAWWGFTPKWARDTKIQPVNARSESAPEKPMFKKAFRHQRCAIPLDWWIEWHRGESVKQPYAIRPTQAATDTPGESPFFLAGLWSKAGDIEGFEGSGEVTYTILTKAPHTDIADIHNRQPVALPLDELRVWLSDDPSIDDLNAIVDRGGFSGYESWPISRRVGNVANNDPGLIEPVS